MSSCEQSSNRVEENRVEENRVAEGKTRNVLDLSCGTAIKHENIIVTSRFAWLLRPVYWTFHVLRLSNINVVTSPFALPRLLRALYWKFHVLRLSSMNVVDTSRFASHTWLRAPHWTFHVVTSTQYRIHITFCIPLVASGTVLDVSCVRAIAHECRSSIT